MYANNKHNPEIFAVFLFLNSEFFHLFFHSYVLYTYIYILIYIYTLKVNRPFACLIVARYANSCIDEAVSI